MKTPLLHLIISIVFLLAWTVSVFGTYCQNEVNSLARLDPWARLGRFFNGDRGLDFNISPLGVHEASQKDQEVMRTLEENGGRGRYVQLGFSSYDRGVQILSPPNTSRYGSVFGEIFQEFDEAGIPVFINSNLDLSVAGNILVQKYGSANSKAVLELRPKTANIINRHELQHLRDFITQTESFKQTLPEVSEPVMRLLEKKEAGERLREEEERMFRAAVDLFLVMAEIKASETTVKNLFTAQGFRELVLTRTWPRELKFYLNDMLLISIRNAQLLSWMATDLPREMFPHHPAIPVIKMMVFGGGGIAIYLGIATGTVIILIGLVF